MFYYEVLPGGMEFHGETALTYSSKARLSGRSVVRIPLRNKSTLGIVIRQVAQPGFATKPILQSFDLPALPTESLALLAWLGDFYPSPLGQIVQLFLPKSLLNKPSVISVNNTGKAQGIKLPALTKEQQSTITDITTNRTYLLHGETGSGKTRIYIELAQKMLANGRSAIILTPEITLTSQLLSNFEAVFPGRVIVVHSNLTEKQRRTIWLRCLTALEPLVVIGPRSALFTPLQDIGLIVIDEFHENAYKQEQSPYYYARRVASKLRQLHRATLVLGSATPPVEDYFMAEQKGVPILRMEKLAKQDTKAAVAISLVDLKHREDFSRAAHLSDKLLQAIKLALEHGEQSLLFLNRRGTARVVLCQICAWQALCPNCDLPLAYHGDFQSLQCHTCGYHQPIILSCPICGSVDIAFKSVGTKAIVDEIHSIFPNARVKRFDADNTKTEGFDQYYERIKAGGVDILVGTQTLAKGLDLPKLTVVGVVCADTSLYLPDYTSQERTYQLLYQVLGRIGRGHTASASRAIIQTYQPDNPILQAALAKNWSKFYETELTERKLYLFPPFCSLLKLTVRRSTITAAHKAASQLVAQLRKEELHVQVIGPAPSFHEKIGTKYAWQVVIKARQRSELLQVIKLLPANWTYDIDPADLL